MATATTSATPAGPEGSIPEAATHVNTVSPPEHHEPHHRPRRQKKDSFMLFADASVPHNASSEDLAKQSIREESPHHEDDDNEPLYRRLIMAPLLSISFILSLFLVERSERRRRAGEHPSANQSFWSNFSLQDWLDPEPYQDPDDTTWKATDAGAGEGQSGKPPHPRKKQWYHRKKAMAVGKAGISDAFDMSGTVMIMLLAAGTMTVLGLGWGVSKAYHGLAGRWHS